MYSIFSGNLEFLTMSGTQLKVKNNSLDLNGLHLVHFEELATRNARKDRTVLPEIKPSKSLVLLAKKKESNTDETSAFATDKLTSN